MDTIKSMLGCGGKKGKKRARPEEDVEEEHLELEAAPKVGLYDGPGMRRALDEAVVQAMETESGMSNSLLLENIRLGIMVLAVVAGIVAHVVPHTPSHTHASWATPPLASHVILGICVALYFILSGVWQLFVWYVERESLFVAAGAAPSGETLCVRSHMKQYSAEYRITVETLRGRVVAEFKTSIGDFYTSDGDLSFAAVSALCTKKVQPALAAALKGDAKQA